MAANSQQPRTVGFDCEFVKPPPTEYIQSECPVCLQIIRETYQVTCCGKKFCKACIERIKDTKKACPTCNEKEFSSYPDKGHKQLLYSLKAYCSHQREGCEWTGELRQLDEHLNTDPLPEKILEGCQLAEIACTNKCEEEMLRKDIENHQNNHCPNRPFSCEHCRDYKATYNDVTQTHWPVCGSFPLPCPNKCHSTLQRQNVDSHVAKECPLTTINCDFHHVGCTVQLPRQDMAEHINNSFLAHISLLAILVGKLETENRQLKAKNTELEQLVKTTPLAVNLIQTENRQLKAKNTELEQLVKATPLAVNPIPLTPPILAMTNYEKHKREADDWYSPPVYTHPRGYKFCLKVCANGRGPGAGTHVTVAVHFMKGEFDDNLKWPFRGSISFQLLDQAKGLDCKKDTNNYNDSVKDKFCSRVTVGERSPSAWGTGKFIAHSALEPKYLHNDTLLFQVYKVEIN